MMKLRIHVKIETICDEPLPVQYARFFVTEGPRHGSDAGEI